MLIFNHHLFSKIDNIIVNYFGDRKNLKKNYFSKEKEELKNYLLFINYKEIYIVGVSQLNINIRQKIWFK